MKTFGWIVAIVIVLYLVGRSMKAKPGDKPAEGVKSPADNLAAAISAQAENAGSLIYSMANEFITPENAELVDQQPIAQNKVTQGDYVITRPFEELMAGVSPSADPRIPRSELKWWPKMMYIIRPPWNECGFDKTGECTCGNGCVTVSIE